MLKKLVILLIVCILIVFAYVSFSLISIFSFKGEISEKNLIDTDYIVILGARVDGDQPTSKLKERLDFTLSLLSKTNAKIIVSGGKGPDEEFHEAIIMKKYLVERDVDEERIILEDKATSTWENLIFSKELIESEDAKVLVISSDYHTFRVNMLIDRLNLEWKVVGSYTNDKFDAVKREVLAILKSYLFDKL